MEYHFSSWLTATLNLCLIFFKITWALAILLEHMHKKFEKQQTKNKCGCQSGRKVVTHNSKSDLPLVWATENSQTFLKSVINLTIIKYRWYPPKFSDEMLHNSYLEWNSKLLTTNVQDAYMYYPRTKKNSRKVHFFFYFRDAIFWLSTMMIWHICNKNAW